MFYFDQNRVPLVANTNTVEVSPLIVLKSRFHYVELVARHSRSEIFKELKILFFSIQETKNLGQHF